MIELVVVYCLRAEPDRCVERRDPLTTYSSTATCTAQAQIIAVAYLAGHPKWMVSGWRCEIDHPRQGPA